MARKAYSYVRFSTPEQAKGDSLRRQTEAAEAFAKRHGLTLDTDLTFHDLGVSAFRGKNASKGALRLFLRAIEDDIIPEGSVLILENLDRMSRKAPWEALPTLQEIINHGVAIGIPMKDKIIGREQLTGPQGVFVLMEILIDLQRAHEESLTKSRRLKAAWSAKRQKAGDKVLTRRVPGWITVNDGRAELVPERAKVVRRIFKDFIAGVGKHGIAMKLNADKVPVFGRGRNWQSTYIYKILYNRATIGELIPHSIEFDASGDKKRTPQDAVPGYYPAVVDEETFERAQALLSAGSPTRGRHVTQKVQNVLASLARCPLCGSTMTRVSKGSRKKAGQPFLVCVRAKTGAGCTYRMVKVAAIESALMRGADNLPRNYPHPDASLQDELDGVEAALANVETQIQNLVDALAEHPSLAVSQQLSKLEAKAAPMRAERDELLSKAAQTDKKLVQRRVERLKEVLAGKSLDVAKVNAALRECFESIVVDYARDPNGIGMLVFTWRHGGESRLSFNDVVRELRQTA